MISQEQIRSALIDADDRLNNVRSLVEAVFMAASDSSLTREASNAIQAVCDVIDDKINGLEAILDSLREEAE